MVGGLLNARQKFTCEFGYLQLRAVIVLDVSVFASAVVLPPGFETNEALKATRETSCSEQVQDALEAPHGLFRQPLVVVAAVVDQQLGQRVQIRTGKIHLPSQD